ncbi:MAG: hypothetical protein ACI3XZ_07290 [Butyricicoccus sp.]
MLKKLRLRPRDRGFRPIVSGIVSGFRISDLRLNSMSVNMPPRA